MPRAKLDGKDKKSKKKTASKKENVKKVTAKRSAPKDKKQKESLEVRFITKFVASSRNTEINV